MGNTNPDSKRLKIYIETQKPFYNSGSSIEGVVFAEAQDNFKFDALYLRIQGRERCQWFEGSSANRNKFTGSDTFYSMEYLLEKYEDQRLEKGKYAYPFSIQLSQNLPGSFQSPNYDAKIEYQLSASFVNYNRPEHRQLHSVPLLIREPFRQELSSYHGTKATNPVSCCCCSEGEVTVTAQFQRNVCFEGEAVRVDIDVDNSDGTSHLKGVMVRLVQYTFISANNGVSRTFKKNIHEHKLSKPVGRHQRKQMHYQLTVPPVNHQTAIGTLVANYFRLEVTADLGTFASEQPSIYAPLFIIKKSFNMKNPKVKQVHPNFRSYKSKKPSIFRAHDYWFRKNKNLSVMNFKLEDMIEGMMLLADVAQN